MAKGVSSVRSRHRLSPRRLRHPAAVELAPSLGEVLRQARHGRGVSLADAERETRIPVKYLAALEEQEWDALPGAVYARGVLRSYARYLELDPEPLLEQLRPARARDERSAIQPALPLAPAGPPLSWSLVVGLLVLVGTVALGVYLYRQYVALDESLRGPERPTTRAGLDVPEPLVAPWTPLPRSPVLALAAPGSEEADPGAAEPAEPPEGPAAAGTPAAATPGPSPSPQPSPRPSAAVTVEARVVERSWLQVWADGRQVFAETVAPGTTRTFTANDTVQMRVGNAGGVQVAVNSEVQGRLGASGQAVDVTWGRR